MTRRRTRPAAPRALLCAGVGLLAATTTVHAGTLTETQLAAVSNDVWELAHDGRYDQILDRLETLPEGSDHSVDSLKSSLDQLNASLAQREAHRQEKIKEFSAELDEKMEDITSPVKISDALKSAISLHEHSLNKDDILHESRILRLQQAAEKAAQQAEDDGQWIIANELYYRLDTLFENQELYKNDVARLTDRLAKIRLYTPERFWELRNERALMDEDGKALPPYNDLGEDYATKLKGINQTLVVSAIRNAVANHISQDVRYESVTQEDLITAGIQSLRALATTTDLKATFPGIGDQNKRERFLRFLDEQERIAAQGRGSQRVLFNFVYNALTANHQTIDVPDEAILHEFGNGAMSVLSSKGGDDFTAIIWPDELSRFKRMTEGKFKGVGVQIQFDEESQMIKVVTPLEGTPAHRAGVRAEDLIKEIDGHSAVGLSLNQAVDRITGPENSHVSLTLQRGDEEVEVELVREEIPLVSVKGWERTGTKEDDWNWFIDEENGIGYIRILSFVEDTTDMMHKAIRQMQQEDFNGLIIDLRFNPGGLLTQAVSVANTFIPRGEIVSTTGMMPSDTHRARSFGAILTDVPIVVLVNQGSASASEIVSGAIRYYADNGSLQAVIVGERTYGKGSVQNVFALDQSRAAYMKLTTQYYMLPDHRIIHRRPGVSMWGVDPHIEVEMLPEQVVDALKIRQDADTIPIDENGDEIAGKERPHPSKLIEDGVDLQLQTALVLLQSQTLDDEPVHARAD